MEVETYEIMEQTIDGGEDNEKALSLIDELNLVGQVTTDNKRLAFDEVNREQQFVINNLFPTSKSIEEYNAGGIPLRILEAYKEHRDSFRYWTVRYAPPAQIIDPILLAHNGDYEHQATGRITSSGIFIIGRWGDALKPWAEMYEQAAIVCREQMMKRLYGIKNSVASDIEMIEQGHTPDDDRPGTYASVFSTTRW